MRAKWLLGLPWQGRAQRHEFLRPQAQAAGSGRTSPVGTASLPEEESGGRDYRVLEGNVCIANFKHGSNSPQKPP